jgi:hypothetical protein
MGIFDIFKSKESAKPNGPEEYQLALDKFNDGEYQNALGSLVWGFKKDVEYKPLYELAIRCLDALGGNEESNLFKIALENMKSFQSFKNLGVHFFQEGHYDLALPFLRKAVQLNSKDSDTVHDLALVLARRFQIEEAISVFEDNNSLDDFWNYWFWCKLRILASRTEGVQEGLNQLIQTLNDQPVQEQIEIPRQKVNEVLEILERFNTIGKPNHDIQDWHFIQYGGTILDYFDETDDFVAGGRYVASWGSNESIKDIIFKLEVHLKNCGVSFDKVYALTDRDSQIIGSAIALHFGKTCTPYVATIDTSNSLIVGANTSDFNDYVELGEIGNNQLTFALNHNWLDPASINPDIIGCMNQTYYFPWHGGGIRIVDMETHKTERTEPDHREPSLIANDINKLSKSQEYNDERLQFYVKYADFLKGTGSKSNKQRFNFMIESPVPGSYFN